MTTVEMIELADRFQTALVGAIGFVGVIWTLRANAKHARDDHARQIETKRQTLRRILAAEFRNYARALGQNLEHTAPTGDTISIGRVQGLFSHALAADLGLLDLNEVDIIVNALISLEGMNLFLENLAVAASETRFILPRTAWNEAQYCLGTTKDALDGAIQVLAYFGEV